MDQPVVKSSERYHREESAGTTLAGDTRDQNYTNLRTGPQVVVNSDCPWRVHTCALDNEPEMSTLMLDTSIKEGKFAYTSKYKESIVLYKGASFPPTNRHQPCFSCKRQY